MSSIEKKSESFKPTVLFVDDDPATAQKISKSFKKQGFDIFINDNFEEIKSSILEHKIDLIMIDLSLSEFQSNAYINFVRQIKTTGEIPVIPYSSHKWGKPEKYSHLSFFDDLFIKSKGSSQKLDGFLKSLKEGISIKEKKEFENNQELPDKKKVSSN